ncbi:ribonuclease HII [Candidatus Saccharibacteria bacterium oral taxon 488]|nr:ribonuclease HII [Candidatus Saccharibacteria bacterium oral taxon 488]QLF52040.1 ribonuclease HII [Candidatus Saccharibacteria bacterium oral taxon 488]
MILGIDEVGRGPWAGPLVVGAVILGGVEIEGLNDSKKLTKKCREDLDEVIREQAAAWALGWVSARELDDVGMSQALRLATRRAVKQIQSQCKENNLAFDEIIIDGTVNFLADTALEQYVTVMAKADGLIPSVSAASIIAKVARDNFMVEQDVVYPGYGFASNAGYGVAKHRMAIERLGVTPLHRLSFAPLQKYVEAGSLPFSSRVHSSLAPPPEMARERSAETSATREHFTTSVGGDSEPAARLSTTRDIGNAGEQAAADWLVADGHEIISRNWRTRYCEIDIVSSKDDTLHFTEVKYRKNDNFGGGLAAITAKKQRQMRFAAELFVAKHPQYEGRDMQILAIAVDGEQSSKQSVVID